MVDLNIHRSVSTLPATVQPNSIYLVRVGTGFDMHVSGKTGNAVALNKRGMAPPNEYAETPQHFYFGWIRHNGGWLVRRQVRANAAITEARAANNAGKASLSEAWAALDSLTYMG